MKEPKQTISKIPEKPGTPKAGNRAMTTTQPPFEDETERRARDEKRGRRRLQISVGVAAAFHVVLLAAQLPQRTQAAPPPEEEPEIYVIQEIRFKEPPPPEPPPPELPPPPEPQLDPPPRPEAQRVPMPDPTPERLPDPPPPELPVFEPVERPEPVTEPPVEALPIERIVEIPAPPPPPEPKGPIHVTGDVRPPVKTHAPAPTYTDHARRAGVEGTVIVQAIIDKQGNVTEVKVLKDLPMGLGRAAENSVKQWKFQPATLGGRPVDVYFNLTVNFNLQ